jgi:hypothetical protein
MSYTNVNTQITHLGNGLDETFNINFYYVDGELNIGVYLYDYTNPSTPIGRQMVPGLDFYIDDSVYPALVKTDGLYGPLPTDFRLLIRRESIGAQTTSFAAGQFPFESVEEAMDKSNLLSQENKYKLDRMPFSKLVVLDSAQTYTAFRGDFIVIAADDVTVRTPTPDLLTTLFIKVDGTRINAILDAGAVGSLIDGSNTYTLLNNYESARLISNGSEWYLI